MTPGFQQGARRVLIVLLVVGLAIAAYAGWWLLTTEPT
jgi:hypothetical protein